MKISSYLPPAIFEETHSVGSPSNSATSHSPLDSSIESVKNESTQVAVRGAPIDVLGTGKMSSGRTVEWVASKDDASQGFSEAVGARPNLQALNQDDAEKKKIIATVMDGVRVGEQLFRLLNSKA